MDRPKLALLWVVLSLAVILAGCGSSSHSPSSPPPQIATTSLPNGSPGVSYQQTLAATGGFSPYTWSITQGGLPSGLTLNATSGLISGTPMGAGTSSFTVQVSDNGTPPLFVTANLSIVINAAPAREAALYMTDGTGFQIASNGSLTLLPSSPGGINQQGYALGSSPTLPLLFYVTTATYPRQVVQSLLVNPDYSLALYSSSASLPGAAYGRPTVDPTGSDLYLLGGIDINPPTAGVLIYAADGSFQSVGSIAVPNLLGLPIMSSAPTARLSFTPDGTLAFITTCTIFGTGSLLSYSRASNGMLILSSTYDLPSNYCAYGTQVSPDGKYLAVGGTRGAQSNSPVVQVFSIASDGTLTAATQPLDVMQDSQGSQIYLYDLVWDSSGSYLFPAVDFNRFLGNWGGVAVVSFSGSSLSQMAYPAGPGVERVLRDGSYTYGLVCQGDNGCQNPDGFDFQNGQLTPLPGSPWLYGNSPKDMVIY